MSRTAVPGRAVPSPARSGIRWYCLLLIILVLPPPLSAQETVVLANGEWPPFFSPQLDHYGAGSRIVSEAFALEGVKVVYAFYPWKRALHLAREGVVDGVVGFDVNPERAEAFLVSDPVWESKWVFFHLKDVPFVWQGWERLAGIPIGGTLEYMYTQEFLDAEAAGKITVFRAGSDELGLRMLLHRNVTLFPQLLEVGLYQLATLFSEDRAHVTYSGPFGTHVSHIFLSRKIGRNAGLLRRFNAGLAKLRASGELDRIFDALH